MQVDLLCWHSCGGRGNCRPFNYCGLKLIDIREYQSVHSPHFNSNCKCWERFRTISKRTQITTGPQSRLKSLFTILIQIL